MDGILGIAGLAIVEVAEFLTRAAVAVHLLSARLLGVLGVRFLFRRAGLCNRARALPPRTVGGCSR